MKKDIKKEKQAEFTRLHTLSKTDVEKLIAEKFKRARAWSEANKKREALVERR